MSGGLHSALKVEIVDYFGFRSNETKKSPRVIELGTVF